MNQITSTASPLYVLQGENRGKEILDEYMSKIQTITDIMDS